MKNDWALLFVFGLLRIPAAVNSFRCHYKLQSLKHHASNPSEEKECEGVVTL